MYIKITSNENLSTYEVERYLKNCGAEYQTYLNPSEIICEELVDMYIDDVARIDLRPLFINIKESLVSELRRDSSNFINYNKAREAIDESIKNIANDLTSSCL